MTTTLNQPVPNVFDCLIYDTVLQTAKELFPNAVKVDKDKGIIIKDRINLYLSLSWNECKIYFYSYNLLNEDADQWSELRKQNNTFRLFALPEFIQYLEMKAKENMWIRNNEG